MPKKSTRIRVSPEAADLLTKFITAFPQYARTQQDAFDLIIMHALPKFAVQIALFKVADWLEAANVQRQFDCKPPVSFEDALVSWNDELGGFLVYMDYKRDVLDNPKLLKYLKDRKIELKLKDYDPDKQVDICQNEQS